MPGNEVEGMDQDRKTRLEEGGINLSGALERFMGNEPMLERYLGKFLTEKSVLVVGCGGVGGYVIESLARSGIGTLILVDFDTIDETNINRQIIALKSTIEGETTTLYLKKIFEGKNVAISRLSYGIPMGTEIDYLDELTLDRALSDRKYLS